MHIQCSLLVPLNCESALLCVVLFLASFDIRPSVSCLSSYLCCNDCYMIAVVGIYMPINLKSSGGQIV